MNTKVLTVLAIAVLLCIPLAGQADGVSKLLEKRVSAPKGWLMVRGGAANTNANYDKEDEDPNGRLMDVSVLCAAPPPGGAAALVATDTTRVWVAFMTSSTTTAINLGGTVVQDPLSGNPNHCLVSGLKLSQIKGIWH